MRSEKHNNLFLKPIFSEDIKSILNSQGQNFLPQKFNILLRSLADTSFPIFISNLLTANQEITKPLMLTQDNPKEESLVSEGNQQQGERIITSQFIQPKSESLNMISSQQMPFLNGRQSGQMNINQNDHLQIKNCLKDEEQVDEKNSFLQFDPLKNNFATCISGIMNQKEKSSEISINSSKNRKFTTPFNAQVDDIKREQLNENETKTTVFINKFQNYIKNNLSIELFGGIASKLNEGSLFLKQAVSIEEVMKFSAFLLSTGLYKQDEIKEYFEHTSFGVQSLISEKTFCTILSTLQNKEIIEKIPQIFSKGFEEARQSLNNKLISTNYLGLFEEFIFQYQSQKCQFEILRNLSYIDSNFFLFKAKANQEIKGNQNEQKTIPTLQDSKESKEITKSISTPLNIENQNNQETCMIDNLIYLFNPYNLALCDIALKQKDNIKGNGKSTSKLSQIQFPESLKQSEMAIELNYSPQNQTNPNNFIQNYLDLLQSQNEEQIQFLEKVVQTKPLKGINLKQYECIGLRVFAESIHTICINIHNQISQFLNQLFPVKNIINKVIVNIMERANQIILNNSIPNSKIKGKTSQFSSKHIGLTFQQHMFIKTKHCNFCIVCQKNGKFTKSKYSCAICQNKYGRCIALCISECDELFHSDPLNYLNVILKVERSKDGHYQKKKDLIMKKIENISVSEYLEQLENYSKTVSFLTKALNPNKSILFEQIHLQKQSLKKDHAEDKQNNSSCGGITSSELEFGNIDNLPLLNLKIEEIESIALRFPPYFQTTNEPFQSTIKSSVNKSRGRKKKQKQNSLSQSDKIESFEKLSNSQYSNTQGEYEIISKKQKKKQKMQISNSEENDCDENGKNKKQSIEKEAIYQQEISQEE